MLHVAPDVTLDHDSEAYLLWHSRLDFATHFGDLLADQARQKADSAAAQRVAGGLLQRLKARALDQPSPDS